MVVYCCHAYVALSYRKDSYGFESSDSASHEKVKLGKKLLGAELCSAATREQWLWVRHAARVDMLLEATGNLRFLHFYVVSYIIYVFGWEECFSTFMCSGVETVILQLFATGIWAGAWMRLGDIFAIEGWPLFLSYWAMLCTLGIPA